MRRCLRLGWLAMAWLSIAVGACENSGAGAPADAARDTADASVLGDAAQAAPGGWISASTTFEDDRIRIERVRYRSKGLIIDGQVCRPTGAGVAPVVIVNHGGFEGITDGWNAGACRDLARDHGYVVAQSAYRGEDASEGAVEVCLGEVDDVLALTRIVLAQPYADPTRVLMYGASHGGCITLRAIERGAPVQSALALVPPTDFAALHAYFRDGLAGDPTDTQRLVWTELLKVIEGATAGTPQQQPAAYRERSPLAFVADLDALPIPVTVMSGTADYLVPGDQGCSLAAVAKDFDAYYVTDGDGHVSDRGPALCAAQTIAWRDAPPSEAWSAKRSFLLYEGMGHGLDGPTGTLALTHVAQFILRRNPPPR